MLHFQTLREGLGLFKALGSETRIAIVELLIDKGPQRMTAIAEELNITGGALTTHIKMLKEAGIISITARSGRHGIQKICRVNDERIIVEAPMSKKGLHVYETEVEIGQFAQIEAKPPCGMATSERVLKSQGDNPCNWGPERSRAVALWIQQGTLEYLVPNQVGSAHQLAEIQISLEVAPGNPTDAPQLKNNLQMSLNGKLLCEMPLPLQDTNLPSADSAVWWKEGQRQRGSFRMITIDANGTHLDGTRISSVRLNDLDIKGRDALPLTITSPAGQGGFTLFGKGLGSRSQGLRVRMYYQPKVKSGRKAAK